METYDFTVHAVAPPEVVSRTWIALMIRGCPLPTAIVIVWFVASAVNVPIAYWPI